MRQSTLDDYQSTGVECPTCDATFESNRAMKAHHQHHERPFYEACIRENFNEDPKQFLRGKTVKCVKNELGCSIKGAKGLFKRHNVSMGGGDLVVCPKCDFQAKNEYGLEQHYAESHNESISGKEFECDWCGSEGRRKPSALNHRNFCNQTCYGEFWSWVRPSFKGFRPEPDSKSKVKCDYCADPLNRSDARISAHSKQFCNQFCHGKWKSENQCGSNNPRWKGGYTTYHSILHTLSGKSWKATRQKYIDENDTTCEMCGSVVGDGIDIHHIIPVLAGGVNEPANLIGLCRSCHMKAENYTKNIPEVKPIHEYTNHGDSNQCSRSDRGGRRD